MKARDFIALLQEQDPELEIKVLSTCKCCTEEVGIETGETFHVQKGRIVLGWCPGVKNDPADYVPSWEREKPPLEAWQLKGLAAPHISSSDILTMRLKARAEHQGPWPQAVIDWVESELQGINADGFASEDERQKMMEHLREGVVDKCKQIKEH